MSVQFLHTEKFHKASDILMALRFVWPYKNQSVCFFLGVQWGCLYGPSAKTFNASE